MNRLLIVSNRLPVKIEKKRGKFNYKESIGGLATGLSSFYKKYDGAWIGWPGLNLESVKGSKDSIVTKLVMDYSCFPVFCTKNDFSKYYHGFSNKTIWPLFHYFVQYAVYEKDLWQAYKRVNKYFAEKILEVSRPGDNIWVHDYHLMLLPRLIRKKMDDVKIGFFLHIPFPSYEIFRLLPWRREILEGILGADLIGFHAYDYTRHFFSSVHRLLGYESQLSQIKLTDRKIKVDSFPMGIDYEKFAKMQNKKEVKKEIKQINDRMGDKKLVLSADRLDYTKGIKDRLNAFSEFLKKYPEYRGKVTLVFVASPSRTSVTHYRKLKRQIDELVGRINGKYGTIEWTPIWYIYRSVPFNRLVALYNTCDVALITPLRDGMNLMAKEFIATKEGSEGILILSETAGAAKELGEAIQINTNNSDQIADALKKALEMSKDEKINRMNGMQNRLRRYNVEKWAQEFLNALQLTEELQKEMKTSILNEEVEKKLVQDYKNSKNRLFLLDYDGTLISFFKKPEQAKPSKEVFEILKNLKDDPNNTVVIISGRKRETLQDWFSNLDIELVAEHGVWLKERDEDWKLIEKLSSDWKDEIKPILKLFRERTPGSFIEEKDYSLAWHYRNVDSEFGYIRTRELVDVLVNFTSNFNLQVLEGNKVVEIKNAGVDKGRAAQRWLDRKKWDFIFAVGDDWTDENLFEVVPESAYSVRVGLKKSKARYNLESSNDVRSLLSKLF